MFYRNAVAASISASYASSLSASKPSLQCRQHTHNQIATGLPSPARSSSRWWCSRRHRCRGQATKPLAAAPHSFPPSLLLQHHFSSILGYFVDTIIAAPEALSAAALLRRSRRNPSLTGEVAFGALVSVRLVPSQCGTAPLLLASASIHSLYRTECSSSTSWNFATRLSGASG